MTVYKIHVGGRILFSSDERDYLAAMSYDGGVKVQVLEMTEEEYRRIPTTSEAAEAFTALHSGSRAPE